MSGSVGILADPTFAGLRAEAWAALGTWAAALATGVGLTFAGRQVRDARKQAFDQNRPYVVVEPTFQSTLVRMRIRNVGATAALDVRLILDEPFKAAASVDVSWQDAGIFVRSMPSLAPDQELSFLLDTMDKRTNSGLPKQINGRVVYGPAGLDGELHSERFVVDLEMYEQSSMLRRNLADLADDVHGIHKLLKKP